MVRLFRGESKVLVTCQNISTLPTLTLYQTNSPSRGRQRVLHGGWLSLVLKQRNQQRAF